MKDKELIENSRLRERTGGYHKFVDSAEVHNPDPTSSHFISEQERFDKDFSVADQKVRAQQYDHVQNRWAHLREERYNREVSRFENMEKMDAQQAQTLQVKKDQFNAGKKNHGGAAYNLLNQQYDQTQSGNQLAQYDEDCRVRALMRAKNINDKSNGSYNILTGAERNRIQVPAHERYNPITNAGQQIMRPSNSRGSAAQGVVPGLF